MPETIQDLMPETPDLNQERLAELKRLMPDIFTDEGKIDEKELHAVLHNAGADEKPSTSKETYEFNWFGKAKAKEDAFTPTRLTLEFDPKRSFNDEDCENVIIEGENLEVLKILLCGYRGKIKCIYIDPPYNTGRDFVYSDKHATEYKKYLENTGKMRDGIKTDANADTSGRYHSDWLSMMYSRLIVAQQLLKPDGVIYISIDDIEIANLKKICDLVFDPSNFISQLIWKSGRTASAHFTNEHEYILCYAKNKEALPLFEFTGEQILSDRAIKRPGKKNPPSEISFPSGIRFDSPDKRFQSKFGDAEPVEVVEGIFEVKDGKLANDVTLSAGWTMKDMIESWLEGEEVIDQKGQLVTEFFFKENGVLQYVKEKGTIHPKTIINGITTKQATSELNSLLGFTPFEYAKPTELLKTLISYPTDEDDLILDFFGGSGSLGHATMALNCEQDTRLRFIVVQLDEATPIGSDAFVNGYKKISDITIERNKRAAKRLIDQAKASDAGALTGNLGFKVFTLEKSYFPRTEWTPEPGTDESAKLASLRAYIEEKEQQQKLDLDTDKLLTEVLVKEGFMLTYDVYKRDDFTENNVFDVDDGEKKAVVCVDTTLTDTTVAKLRELIGQKVVVIERALDTTKKWNLHNALGEKFRAF